AVYMPACVNRIFGAPAGNGGGLTLPGAMVAVSAPRGGAGWGPPQRRGHRWARPPDPKGESGGGGGSAKRTPAAPSAWGGGGGVRDPRPWAYGRGGERAARRSEETREGHEKLEILDSVAGAKRLLPELEISNKIRSVAAPPPCSTRHMGLTRALQEVAGAIAE